MKNTKKKILFISRIDAFNVKNIIEFIDRNFDAEIITGDRNLPLPQKAIDWSGDYIFSYLNPWILPEQLIKKARIAAINFHPGSPSYPGSGCYNFALYHESKEYGVTCHLLEKTVDTGDIISIKLFPIFNNDRVEDLINRTYVYLNYLFFEVCFELLRNSHLKGLEIKWDRKPYRKKDLDELCKLSKSMDDSEIKRRIRATTFPGKPGPYFID